MALDSIERPPRATSAFTEGDIMANYLVRWEIDIQTVDSPRNAALQALDTQRNPESIATVFEVVNRDTGAVVTIDLEDE